MSYTLDQTRLTKVTLSKKATSEFIVVLNEAVSINKTLFTENLLIIYTDILTVLELKTTIVSVKNKFMFHLTEKDVKSFLECYVLYKQKHSDNFIFLDNLSKELKTPD